MELRQIELFSVLADEQHFGRAAQRLHISQPALTYQIQRLEEELGLQLLRRSTRRVELTAAGVALRAGSQPLIDEMTALVDRVRKIGHGDIGIVRVGCVASALHGVVPAMIRAARERHPDVEFILTEKKTGTQLEDLASGRLDIGLIHLPARVPAGIEIQELFRQPVGLAVPDDHPAASLSVVDLGSLAGESFVLFPRALEPDTYDRFVGACVSAGFAPKVSQEAENIQALLALVSAGLGVAFVPESVMDGPSHVGVAFRRLAVAPEITTAIAWPRELRDPAADAFRRIAIRTMKGAAGSPENRPPGGGPGRDA